MLKPSLRLGSGLAVSAAIFAAAPAQAAQCVVLVHGLGRGPASLAPLGRSLAKHGYKVVNLGYPSTRQSVEASTEVVERSIAECRARGASRIHFVTHSLGGIVLRRYLLDRDLAEGGRVVMLAPPNRGSEIADRHGGRWWYTRLTGPAGQEMTTAAADPRPFGLELGVIAGTRNYEPWFAASFAGPNDGKVTVESARLDGMADFLTVHAGHTFIANSSEVKKQVAAFLATGRFARP